MTTLETKYTWDGYDEFEEIKPAANYRIAKSRTRAFDAIKQRNGLTTIIRLESGELTTLGGRAEIIGTYDPSITLSQFRSDTIDES